VPKITADNSIEKHYAPDLIISNLIISKLAGTQKMQIDQLEANQFD
jgi:hypothetical protein